MGGGGGGYKMETLCPTSRQGQTSHTPPFKDSCATFQIPIKSKFIISYGNHLKCVFIDGQSVNER